MTWVSLKQIQREDEDYGYRAFTDTIDTVLVGRKTYDWVVSQGYEFPHDDKQTYVITHTSFDARKNITCFNGDPVALVSELRHEKAKIFSAMAVPALSISF